MTDVFDSYRDDIVRQNDLGYPYRGDHLDLAEIDEVGTDTIVDPPVELQNDLAEIDEVGTSDPLRIGFPHPAPNILNDIPHLIRHWKPYEEL